MSGEAATGGPATGGGAGVAAPAAPAANPATPNPAGGGTSGAAPETGAPKGSAAPQGDAPGTPPEVPPTDKKYKVRIGKKETEVTRAQLLEHLESEVGEDGVLDFHALRRGAYERFEESKKAKTELQKMQQLLQNPDAVYEALARKHGPEAAARMVEQQYKRIEAYRKMTPEQQAAWRERQQVEHDKKQIAEFKARQAAEQKRAQTAEQAKVVQTKFTEALTEAGVPVNPASIARMAMIAKDLLKRGVPATYGEVAKRVREDITAELRTLVKGLPREKIREYLGDEHIQYIRQLELEALEAQGPQPGVVTPPRGPDGKFQPIKGKPAHGDSVPEPKKKIPIHEWRRQQEAERRRADGQR